VNHAGPKRLVIVLLYCAGAGALIAAVTGTAHTPSGALWGGTVGFLAGLAYFLWDLSAEAMDKRAEAERRVADLEARVQRLEAR
jgi:hypothetical protein